MDFSIFSTNVCEKVKSLYFLNPKFQASCHLPWLYSAVCVEQVGNPEDRFCSEAAHVYEPCREKSLSIFKQ